jgi:hypothetical protein
MLEKLSIQTLPNIPLIWDTCAIIGYPSLKVKNPSIEDKTRELENEFDCLSSVKSCLETGKSFYAIPEVLWEFYSTGSYSIKKKVKKACSHLDRFNNRLKLPREYATKMSVLRRASERVRKIKGTLAGLFESKGRLFFSGDSGEAICPILGKRASGIFLSNAQKEIYLNMIEKYSKLAEVEGLSFPDLKLALIYQTLLKDNGEIGIVSNDSGMYFFSRGVFQSENNTLEGFNFFSRMKKNLFLKRT